MAGVPRGGEGPVGERRAAGIAVGLLAALIVADIATAQTFLGALLVVCPLVAALACRERTVLVVAALTLLGCVVLGAVDDLFLTERHSVAMAVVLAGSVLAVVAAHTRATLATARDAREAAYQRIALLDRSSRLAAAPMDFRVRLQQLAALPVPDIAQICVIDLTTPDGQLEGIVVAAEDPAAAAAIEATRAQAPIDPQGPHPVAVALRSGEPQLRGTMTGAELEGYAASSEHNVLMRRLDYRSAIVVPLIARGTTLGVLSVIRTGASDPFAAEDVTVLTDLASRAAAAVDTSRLFAEQRRAEDQLRTVIDGLAEAIVMVSREGKLVYVNDAGAGLFGYERAEDLPPIRLVEVHEGYDLYDEGGAPLDPAVLPGRRVLEGEAGPPVTYRRVHRVTGEEQWLTVKASAVHDPDSGEPTIAVNVIEDITTERRAREAASFLSEASRMLASSLDFEVTLGEVAGAAAGQIADLCVVDLVGASGQLEQVALAHADPAKEPLIRELRERYPAPPEVPQGSARVARTGVPELHPSIGFEQLAATAIDDDHRELLRAADLTSILVVPVVSRDRILGTIGLATCGRRRRLTDADRELAEEVGRRAGAAVEHARVYLERSHVAATLQRSLLPPRLPVLPGMTLAARFRAAGEGNQVGGDFYDLFRAGDSWIVVIGDVTGKGPGAAAITSLARYTIRTAALYETTLPGIVSRLNDALLADDEHRQMCTAACLRITPAPDGGPIAVQLVCAGHPPPFLLRADGTIDEICRPGPLLGAFTDSDWTSFDFDLAGREALVLYTDGVTDARGPDGRFGQERLEDLLRAAAGQRADAIAARVDGTLLDFQEGPQRDDVALLVLRAEPGGGAETSLVAGSVAAGA